MCQRFLTAIFLCILVNACGSLHGVQQEFTVCDYDHAWQAALEVAEGHAISTQDKEAGLIVTNWLEIPMPGRRFGVMRRELAESKDRSRVTINVKRLDDVIRISFVEQRQEWAFRGGSRLMGWVPTDPSTAVMQDIQTRLDSKLKEQGCSLS